MSAGSPVRVGLVGAGPWAALHAQHLAAHPLVDFVGVWARRPEAAADLAGAYGVSPYDDLDALIADCDAVDLCVPPAVQPQIAIRAARAGRHLLLEKPIAMTVADAEQVARACDEAGVVSQVMLTRRFHPITRAFLGRLGDELPPASIDGLTGEFVHGAFLGGKFATPWRLQEGVLLDLGPHLLDLVEQVAGPIVDIVSATGSRHALAITTRHEFGAVGQLLLSGHSAGATRHEVFAFGESGKESFTADQVDEDTCFRVALDEFVAAVRTGGSVVADVHRGVELQRLIDQVQQRLGVPA